jgi:UDP-glucose 4-epimerase
MNVLITGGGGFLGAHLALRLLEAGHRVTLYDLDFPASGPAAAPRELQRERGDIRDAPRLAAVLQAQHSERVVHLAARLTTDCAADPADGIDVNCRGSAVVFETAGRLGIPRVLFGSSVAVFNDDPALPWDDSRPYGPTSLYGLTKMFTEQLAGHMRQRHPQTTYLGLRFGWVYGPGRDRGWREVQAVIESFARGEPRVAYPDYAAALDWTYIEDAVAAVVCTLDSPPPGVPAYNVSGDCRTIQEAVAILQDLFPGVQADPYPAELPPVGWQFQNDHIQAEAGFRPRFALEAGLQQFLAALQAAPPNEDIRKDNG